MLFFSLTGPTTEEDLRLYQKNMDWIATIFLAPTFDVTIPSTVIGTVMMTSAAAFEAKL